MYAVIEPVPVFPSTAHVLTLDNVLVMPGSSARFWWRLRVDEGSPELTSGMTSLTGAAYDAWGTDDEYLYRYAAEALGLTITEIVPDAVATSPVASPAPVEAPVAPPVVEEPVVAPVVVEEPVVAPLEADPAAGAI